MKSPEESKLMSLFKIYMAFLNKLVQYVINSTSHAAQVAIQFEEARKVVKTFRPRFGGQISLEERSTSNGASEVSNSRDLQY